MPSAVHPWVVSSELEGGFWAGTGGQVVILPALSQSPQGRAACFPGAGGGACPPAPRAVSLGASGWSSERTLPAAGGWSKPLWFSVSWGGSVSHRGLYKPQVNGGVCSGGGWGNGGGRCTGPRRGPRRAGRSVTAWVILLEVFLKWSL